jgi:rhodanese-related sulfurtransferase
MFRLIIKQQPVTKRFKSTMTTANQVNAIQLQTWLNTQKENTIHNDICIIDVRERREVEKFGKIKGAINVPFKSDLFIAGLSDLNKQSKVSLLLCQIMFRH